MLTRRRLKGRLFQRHGFNISPDVTEVQHSKKETLLRLAGSRGGACSDAVACLTWTVNQVKAAVQLRVSALRVHGECVWLMGTRAASYLHLYTSQDRERQTSATLHRSLTKICIGKVLSRSVCNSRPRPPPLHQRVIELSPLQPLLVVSPG